MQKMSAAKQKLEMKREHLLQAYREVVHSVREARTMQGVLEKERQMRRLQRYLGQMPQG